MKTEDKRFLIIVAFNAIAFAADGLVKLVKKLKIDEVIK